MEREESERIPFFLMTVLITYKDMHTSKRYGHYRTSDITKFQSKTKAYPYYRLDDTTSGTHRNRDYRYESRTGCASRSSFLICDYKSPKAESSYFRDSTELQILTPSSYFTTIQNGTTRQTDDRSCLRRFSMPFDKTGFTG